MSLHATAGTVYQCIDVHAHFVRTSIPHDFRGAAATTVCDNGPPFSSTGRCLAPAAAATAAT